MTEFYGGFVKVVADGRVKLPAEKVKALADGRIYTGMQAKANGLVDDLGGLKDAVALAKKRSGTKAARVVMYGRSWGQPSNIYSGAAMGGMQVNLLNISVPDAMTWFQPQFLYLWTGDGGGSN